MALTLVTGDRFADMPGLDPTFADLPYRSLGDAALTRARELGVTHADFRFERVRYQSLRVKDGVLQGASDAEVEKGIQDIFINIGRLSDLGSMLRVSIIQKLAPSLQKPGYEETTESQSSDARPTNADNSNANRPQRDPLRDDRNPEPARPYPLADPLAHPRRPMPEPMPGFEDEFDTQRPARGGLPGAGFPRIGDRDLYPQGLGPNDPFRGGMGPGFGGGMGGGGMHPTFDDPMFAGQGPRGGGGYDPQVPPGARFDPMGPGFGGRGGGGHPRGAGMGGRPPNPFGGFGDGDFL